ncbi:hypothetical protein PV11_00993 [Exophiala sideris]|uniref:Response regulatory domain-containing protein n=1 Tax=Exophiala sideris TaxID=1016849 RepID=A0A0D1W905_9EURO|nr:hypothetical protein PV11_00993 [Exophiala sideris]
MPLSRTRSLFRSLSGPEPSHKSIDEESNSSTKRQGPPLSFNFPTLTSLSSLALHRRGRRKSETTKRKSVGNNSNRSKSRDLERCERQPEPNPTELGAAPNRNPDGGLKVPSAAERQAQGHAPATATASPASPASTEPTSFSATTTPHQSDTSTPHDRTSVTEDTVVPSSSSSRRSPLSPDTPNTIATAQPPVPPLLVLQRPSSPTVPTLPSLSCSRNGSDQTMQRKIWVKRPGASPTRVEVAQDDLVDNVRDVILQKYANSLGRNIDAPDITLKIVSREQNNKNVPLERALGPEEPIGSTLDTYYPGGQTVEEALVIEVVTVRRTPRPSPRAGNHQISYYYQDQYRPDDGAREYFPPMPLHSPHLAHVPPPHAIQHSMSVLTTGQLPPLPSPGSHGQRRHARPKYGRQHTSSPTILHTVQPNGQVIESKPQMNGAIPTAPPLPTPEPQGPNDHKPSITPPNRITSPHAGQKSKKRKNPVTARSASGEHPSSNQPASAALLDGTVPPINVLLVEDNVINLKLLEAFMKRLKVRWQSAINGKEAVAMWRKGGFHLVLMDIQLPIMNGLEATKEIRRLEAVNGIGVFGGSPIETHPRPTPKDGEPLGEADALPDRSLFKSPVIIVALTASSLQSDRHEALAAGCNDFLTKPVNFIWMERKVTEWGCMQALIDFDGWRKWKQYAREKAAEDPAKKAAEEKEEKAKAKAALKAMFSRPPPSVKKDSADSLGSTSSERPTPPPTANGTPKKASSPTSNGAGGASRGHKSTRSTANAGRGSLGSMAEQDETES